MCRDVIKATTLCTCFSTSWLFLFVLWNAFFKKNLCFWSGFPIFCRIIVSLKEEVWYQKCHDPECRNFRSSSKLWTACDGFIKSIPGVWTILFSLKGYPLPLEICISYIMTRVSSLCFYLCTHLFPLQPSLSVFLTKSAFSPTGRGRPALFNGWGWQHWTQSDSKLCTSGEGICWRMGRQPRWPEICRESGGLWTKERRNPGWPSAYVYAGIGHVDGERV